MRNKALIFLGFIIFSSFGFSQEVIIRGTIRSSKDGLPIDNVNISIKGTNNGTSSDKDGEFTLKNIHLPAILRISHLAFFSKDVALSKDDVKKGNTIVLDILLSEKITNLAEVIISEKPPVYQLERLIYDFEIDDTNLFIIRNSKDKKLLQVYSFNNYLRYQKFIPKECNVVEYDYSNNVVVRKKKEAKYYQVSIKDNQEIILLNQELDVVQRGIDKIVTNKKNYYGIIPSFHDVDIRHLDEFQILNTTLGNRFFSLLSNNKKSLFLYMIHKLDNSLKYTCIYYTTYSCGDWLLDKEDELIDVLGKLNARIKFVYIPSKLAYNLKSLNNIRTNFRNNTQNGLFLSRQRIPVFVQTKDTNVLILNLELKTLYILNSKGKLINQKELDYEFKDKELERIDDVIFNQDKTKCYVVFHSPYTTKLQEIDLETGKSVKTISLRTHFIEKIRIVGDYIYYTARANTTNGFERCLYKEVIN